MLHKRLIPNLQCVHKSTGLVCSSPVHYIGARTQVLVDYTLSYRIQKTFTN